MVKIVHARFNTVCDTELDSDIKAARLYIILHPVRLLNIDHRCLARSARTMKIGDWPNPSHYLHCMYHVFQYMHKWRPDSDSLDLDHDRIWVDLVLTRCTSTSLTLMVNVPWIDWGECLLKEDPEHFPQINPAAYQGCWGQPSSHTLVTLPAIVTSEVD